MLVLHAWFALLDKKHRLLWPNYFDLDLFNLATKKASCLNKQAIRGPTTLSPFRGTRQWEESALSKDTTAAASRLEPGTSRLRVCGLTHSATTAMKYLQPITVLQISLRMQPEYTQGNKKQKRKWKRNKKSSWIIRPINKLVEMYIDSPSNSSSHQHPDLVGSVLQQGGEHGRDLWTLLRVPLTFLPRFGLHGGPLAVWVGLDECFHAQCHLESDLGRVCRLQLPIERWWKSFNFIWEC